MSEARAGVVSNVSVKPWFDSRAGRNIDLHSFQLQGVSGWFRTGTKAVVSVGQYVKFFADDKNSAKDIVIGEATAGQNPPAAQQSASAGRATSGGRDGYWEAKEAKDIEKDARYQAVDIPRMSFSGAQDRAVRLVAAMLANDILPVSTAKKADKYDIVMGLVQEVTNRFFMDNMHAHERLAALESGEMLEPNEEIASAEEE